MASLKPVASGSAKTTQREEVVKSSPEFVRAVKDMFHTNSMRANVKAENELLRSLYARRRKCAASPESDIYYPSKADALNEIDIEIYKVKFDISNKLLTNAKKIDKILYYYFVRQRPDLINFKNKILQNNIKYVQYMLKRYETLVMNMVDNDELPIEEVVPRYVDAKTRFVQGQVKYYTRKYHRVRSEEEVRNPYHNTFWILRDHVDDVRDNFPNEEDSQNSVDCFELKEKIRFTREIESARVREVQAKFEKARSRVDFSNVSYDVQQVYQETTIPRNMSLWERLKQRLMAFAESRKQMIVSEFARVYRASMRQHYHWRNGMWNCWLDWHIRQGHREFEMLRIPYEWEGDLLTNLSPAFYEEQDRRIAEENSRFDEFGSEALPEMETSDAHGEGEVTQTQASNVVLTENREESKEVAADFQVQTWKDLCSTEFAPDYNLNVDRWILIDTLDWTTSSTQGALLASYQLPYYMVKKETLEPCRMPNTLPFTIHRYWRGDLEVKIQVNANKFQIGSLQCSWYYSPDLDVKKDVRMNIYTQSQAHHVLVNASTSNEASLIIPFKYHLPYLHTKPRADMPAVPLNLGTLYIRVLNELTTSQGGPMTANVSIFVRSFNNEFTGMIAGNLDQIETVAEPEMDKVLDTGLGLLNMLHPDINRDNPPAVMPPHSYVPMASHSWAVGNGLPEPIHPLRLDGRGQTPHPPGIEVADEMNVMSVIRTFGLVRTIKWTKQTSKNSILYECDAAPFSKEYSIYTPPTKASNVGTYNMTPLGVISNMFYGWRGTIEFRFDIVASQFHTGRLIVAFIPGVTRASNVKFEHLRASTNIVFSLQESDQFVFKVPYICNKPYWPREYASDYDKQNVGAPSRLYLGVVNALIPMQSVSDTVFINMYMRAGDDFEVMVPVQPSIGLPYDTSFIVQNSTKTVIHAQAGYYPYYIGAFEDFDVAQVMRWGAAAHEIAHFDDFNHTKTATVSYCEIKVGSGPKYFNGSILVECNYCVFAFVDQLGYNCGIPCPSKIAAYNLAANLQLRKKTINDPENTQYVISNTFSTKDNTYVLDNPDWVVKEEPYPKKVVAVYEGERDAATTLIDVGAVRKTLQGMMIYGESFGSLKDLCRRYQLYGVYNIAKFNPQTQEYVKVRFPVLPQGLKLDKGKVGAINELFNRCREGHIPIVSSGYRFYRGSVRFRCILDPKLDCAIVVQHRPDRRLRYNNMQSEDSVVIIGDSVLNHTYASYIQLTNINGVIEFEIPFYQLGMYGLLQYPNVDEKSDASNYYSLGEVVVSIVTNTSDVSSLKNSLLTVYYSIGDDMSFSTFQGFPPMILNSEIPDGTPPASVDVDAYAFPEIELFDSIKTGVSNLISHSVENTVKAAVSDEFQKMDPFKKQILEKLECNVSDSVFKIICQSLHLSQSRSIQTICLVVLNILLELKFIVFDNIFGIVKILTSAVSQWLSRSSREVITGDSDIPQVAPESLFENFDAKDWGPFVGALFSGVSAAMALTVALPKDLSLFSNFMVKTIPQIARNFTFISVFVNSIVDMAKRMMRWIMNKCYPSEKWYIEMRDDAGELKDWVDEVLYLTSLDVTNMLDEDGYLYDRVYSCMLYGREMANRYCESKDKNIHLFFKVYDKINDLYWKMQAAGRHPFVRKEPFCIWVCGDPGIGKSYLTEFLTTALLKHINYKLVGPKMFTVMPTGDFWTGCKNQPVLCMDDAFAVELNNTLEKQLNTMYMVKSPVPLNPPMADLKDKHLRYNPEIFYINSNIEYLNISGVKAGAIHRRRDVMILARIVDGKTSPSEFTPQQLKNFEHLEFCISANPGAPPPNWQEPMSYVELLQILKPMFKKFTERETENYNNRLATYDDIENGRSHAEQLDDAQHILSVGEIAQTKHQRAIDEYRKAYEACIYNKAENYFNKLYDWVNDLHLTSKISKFVNPLMVRVQSFAPEMDYEGDGEGTSSSGSATTSFDRTIQDQLIPASIAPYFSKNEMFERNEDAAATLHEMISNLFEELQIKWDKDSLKIFSTLICSDQLERQREVDGPLLKKDFDAILYNLRRYLQRNKYFLYKKPWKFWEVLYDALIIGTNVMHLATGKHSARRAHWVNCWHSQSQDSPYNVTFHKDKNLPWNLDGVELPTHCKEGCMLDVPLCAAFWYHAWLGSHSVYHCLYKRGSFDELPMYFNVNSDVRDLKKEIDRYFVSWPTACWEWCTKTLPSVAVKVLACVCSATVVIGAVCAIIWGVKSIAKLFGCTLSDDVAALVTCVGVKPPTGSIAQLFGVTEGAYAIPSKVIKRPDVKVVTKLPEIASQRYNEVINVLNRNTVIITAEYFNEKNSLVTMRARALGIESNRVLMIRHYHDEFKALEKYSPKYYVQIVTGGQLRNKVEIDYLGLRIDSFYCKDEYYGTNFFILYMPATIPLFKDIKNFFPTQKDHEFCGRLGHIYSFGDTTYKDITFSYHGEYRIMSLGNSRGMTCMNAYAYGHHKPGMCGSILISDALGNSPLIGMHVAGANGTGFAEPLYREMFEMLTKQTIVDVEEPTLVEATAEISLETVVFVEGTCSPQDRHSAANVSAIIPSDVHGIFPVLYEPAPLKVNDPRLPPKSDPLKLGCEHHGMPVSPFSTKDLERAASDLSTKFNFAIIPIRKSVGILSEEVAICGDVHYPHYESLEWNSSPGFGYNDVRKGNGKRFLFNLNLKETGMYELVDVHPKLREVMTHKQNLREKGIVPNTVFVDCLKDTTMPAEKCRVPGKTRIFSISPVDFTIQFKQYCGDFLAAYTKSRFAAEHAIGINCDSEEWTGLYNHLALKSNNFIAGDYSNFGPGLSLDVANAAFEIIINWYRYHGATAEHLRILEVMKHEILNARHLCKNVFYSVCCGIPSGSPITAPLNSMVNSLYMRLMWISMFRTHPLYHSMESFNEHVRIITYGDDILGTVSNMVRDLYNIQTLHYEFAKYGIKFTDARKTGNIIPYLTDISEVWFLSRCFIPHPTRLGIWLAGLKKESVENTANWIKKKGCRRDASLVNSRMAIELSFGWGPEYYTQIRERVLRTWSHKKESLHVKTWEERDREIFDFKEYEYSFFPVLDF